MSTSDSATGYSFESKVLHDPIPKPRFRGDDIGKSRDSIFMASVLNLFCGGREETRPEEPEGEKQRLQGVIYLVDRKTKTVTAIGHYQCRFALPGSVMIDGEPFPLTHIGYMHGNIAMDAIDVPDSVQSISSGDTQCRGKSFQTFHDCDHVTTFRFGPGSMLQTIDGFAPSGLVHIAIPASVVKITHKSFCWCQNLQSVTFKPNSNLISIEGFKKCVLEEIDIPDSVETVDGFGKSRIRKIHFGPGTHRKCINGFQMCGFESLEIPHSLEEIGRRLSAAVEGLQHKVPFAACKYIKSVKFAKNSQLKSIGGFALFGMESIELPESLEVIEDEGFYSMTRLGRVTFGANLQIRVIKGFRACQIAEIDIPDSVEKIGGNAFCQCESLARVGFGPGSKLIKINGFHFCHFTQIELPESIEDIDDYAFLWCEQLTVVKIRGCPNLKRLSGLRPKRGNWRVKAKRMVEFERDACISRLGICRFGRRIDLWPGFRKDPLYDEFREAVKRYRQRPTFMRYSEPSMRRFREEFEWMKPRERRVRNFHDGREHGEEEDDAEDGLPGRL
jgi:hypothetical protein